MSPKIKRILIAVVVIVGLVAVERFTGIDLLRSGAPAEVAPGNDSKAHDARDTRAARETGSADEAEDAQRIADAFRSRSSNVWVETGGRVTRILPDDRDGSRHQKFIVRLPNDHTVLIAHNIDLAPRAPVAEGDTIAFRGEYEWSERGGVVHWTHHDPQGRREGGWLHLDGKTYK